MFATLATGALVSIVAGLDRTAAFQTMICRPLVAGPLTGWLLGDATIGLTLGTLVELLWLSRLPVGAAVPLDDTQITIAATVAALLMGPLLGQSGLAFTLLCLLAVLPVSKCGQLFERLARQRNHCLVLRAQRALQQGNLDRVEQSHLLGLLHFSGAALLSYLVLVGVGCQLLRLLVPLLLQPAIAAAPWLRLGFFLVGTAALLRALNVNRCSTLFTAAFVGALLMLWLT